MCTNEFSFFSSVFFYCAISTLAPLCFEPVTGIFFFFCPPPQLCSAIPTRLQLQSFPYLHSTIVLSDQDILHNIPYQQPTIYTLYACNSSCISSCTIYVRMRIYSLTFFIAWQRGGDEALAGLRNWLFCFSIKYFSFIKFSIYKNVHSFARTICIRCEFVMCCCFPSSRRFFGYSFLFVVVFVIIYVFHSSVECVCLVVSIVSVS